jgi:6-bladed beta-propeller
MLSPIVRVALVATCVLAGACSAGTDASGGTDPSGLVTVFDTTADSIIARVSGDVPPGAVRKLADEVRIAPSVDDTSLFTNVEEVDVDQASRLWVYDYPSNSILLFASNGKLVRRIGRKGSGPGEFTSDGGMVVLPDSGLAIWDAQNARVSFFSSSGDFRTSWRTPTGFVTQNGLVTDRSGALFLRRPVTAAREGEILGRMGLVRLMDQGAAISPTRTQESVPLGDSLAPPDIPVPRETYVSTSPDGHGRSAMSSQYAPNYFWGWHPDGYFVAAHGGKYEIVLARTRGMPLVIKRDYPQIPLVDQERKDEEARIYYSMRRTNPSWSWQGPPVPDNKAPMSQLVITRDGRIWVFAPLPSERIPDDELDQPRDKNAPVRHYRAAGVWEVFADDGRFLGRVPLPPRSTLVDADGDLVWAITRDDQDLQAVVRMRITPALQ